MVEFDFKIETNNLDEVKEALAERVALALETIGMKAEGYASMLAPVDTGRLKNSITHEMEGDDTVCIGTNVEYAAYVEMGHRMPNGKSVDPQPYLEPAITNHMPEYQSIIEEHLKNA